MLVQRTLLSGNCPAGCRVITYHNLRHNYHKTHILKRNGSLILSLTYLKMRQMRGPLCPEQWEEKIVKIALPFQWVNLDENARNTFKLWITNTCTHTMKFKDRNWNQKVMGNYIFSSPAAPEVVMTTSGAASDEKFVNATTLRFNHFFLLHWKRSMILHPE